MSKVLLTKLSNAEEQKMKEIVAEALEKKGVLSTIRAQLRAEVYSVIYEQEDKTINSDGNKLLLTQSGTISLQLIREFLEFHGFNHSLNTFLAESRFKETINKTNIATLLNIQDSASNSLNSCLETLVQQHISTKKGNEIKYSQDKEIFLNEKSNILDSSSSTSLSTLLSSTTSKIKKLNSIEIFQEQQKNLKEQQLDDLREEEIDEKDVKAEEDDDKAEEYDKAEEENDELGEDEKEENEEEEDEEENLRHVELTDQSEIDKLESLNAKLKAMEEEDKTGVLKKLKEEYIFGKVEDKDENEDNEEMDYGSDFEESIALSEELIEEESLQESQEDIPQITSKDRMVEGPLALNSYDHIEDVELSIA